MISVVHPAAERDPESRKGLADDIQVLPLRQWQVWKASKSWYEAFLDDPLVNYIRAGEKPDPMRQRTIQALQLSGAIHSNIVLAVDGGSALLIAEPAQHLPSNPVQRIIDGLIGWISKALRKSRSEERQKRAQEVAEKGKKAMEDALGDRVKDMMYVALVCTSPDSQGHGYGSALLSTITRMADSKGQAAWLQSSNTLNEGFYNLHGFVTVGEAYMGEGNPEWKQDPVVSQVMVREPQSCAVRELTKEKFEKH